MPYRTPASLTYERWSRALSEELEFWDGVMRTGGEWPDDIAARLDPNTPFQHELRKLIEPVDGRVRVLDVGAGPFTILGKQWPGVEVDIVATDALADEYRVLRATHGITAPVPTLQLAAEELAGTFSPDTFDLAYARNSLDHAFDPVRIIQAMIAVVKPSCWVVLDHVQREADRQGHKGLHQWNLYLGRDREFVIEGGGTTTDVTSLVLDSKADAIEVMEQHDWIHVEIRKKRRA